MQSNGPERFPGNDTLLKLGLAALLATASVAVLPAPDRASTSRVETIEIDGEGDGRTFDGVGALSASSSRLLVDYPEPERSQILDYLFEPNYGASLQILKTEIGGDTNSTSGAEPSHMRSPTEVDCHRGFEWWLMHEATERNPEIDLYGLVWGVPGWVETWSQEHVDYLLSWLGCAREHGLEIDYLGGGNESGAYRESEFFVTLDEALEDDFPGVEIVADDDHRPPDYWEVATALADDAEFRSAVDVVGVHTICGWRTPYEHCTSSADALSLDKPLWISEQSSQDAHSGAAPLARALTRSYIDARTTANLNWPMLAAFYSTVRTGGTGLMLAQWPWSGYYELGAGIWVDAHMTQFTEPGWQYLDDAVGYLDSGGSYVTLRSPETDDYSVVVETVDADEPTTIDVELTGGLSGDTVHVWSTDVTSERADDWFVQQAAAEPTAHLGDGFTVTLEPGHITTLSTTTGQGKGSAEPTDPDADTRTRMEMPLEEDFESVTAGEPAPYFADLEGAFEAAPCAGDRRGTCYRQVITEQPAHWHPASAPDMPTTVMGDPQWWGDYEISVDAMLEEPGHVEVVGRSEGHLRGSFPGYHFRVNDAGQWRLYSEDADGTETDLATGRTPFGVEAWHNLRLRFTGDRITASVDGREVAQIDDDRHTTGMTGLAVSPYKRAQFDNVDVARTAPEPRFVPQSDMTATATSAHVGLYDHHFYSADRAIDGRPETMWGSEWDPHAPLPQSITLDLGAQQPVWGLAYQPRLDTYRNDNAGTISEYTISVSRDGDTFTEVSDGTWPVSTATRVEAWGEPQVARYVRLEATSAVDDIAVAGEINILSAPFRAEGSSR
ncbi:MAG TPA: discoidin domain-containing protein [Jiangellaceae bacterium]|nr:discoidin domain-containing protein [Jiangellaceae bacterium]